MTRTIIDIDITGIKADFKNDETLCLEVPAGETTEIPDHIQEAIDTIAKEMESEVMYHALYESIVKQYLETHTVQFLQQRIK